jgi:hypothetical protein
MTNTSISSIFVIIFTVLFSSCNSGYGEKLMFEKGELFFTKNVEKSEAEKLGEYLLINGYFDSQVSKSVQLDKKNGVYQFRAVVQSGKETDELTQMSFAVLGAYIKQDVFANQPFEVHLCNEKLETLLVLDESHFPNNEELMEEELDETLELEFEDGE